MRKLRTRTNLESKTEATRKSSERQEKQIAKSLNAKRTSNSGASFFGSKGDLLLENWTIEAKTTQSHKKSFSIKKDWLYKLKEESLYNGKKFEALAFQFGPEEENFYVIDENTFKLLLSLTNKNE